MKKIWILFFLSFFFSCSPAPLLKKQGHCFETRAAFDIGSGATRMKVAKVDTCKRQIIKMLLEEEAPVSYKENINLNGEFSQEILAKGRIALGNLKEKAKKFSPHAYIGVASAAFRDAKKNGESFLKEIEEQLKISIKIISQDYEAELGYWGLLANKEFSSSKIDPDKIIVWDIGGGSTQMTLYDKGKFIIYNGNLASVGFKNLLIEKIQKKDIRSHHSPNPISQEQAEKSQIEIETWLSRENIPKEISLGPKDRKVIGIGGLHYYSIRGQIDNKTSVYTKNEVSKTLAKRLNLTDEEIGGPFASTEVSNLIYVLAFMNNLNIDEVHTYKTNLADGLLISEKF